MPNAERPPSEEDTWATARRLSAITFLDVVGYSALMAENAARTLQDWMHVLREIIQPVTQRHRGRVVKSTGDGVLAEFASANDAIAWAIAVQDVLLTSGPMTARISIHVDEVFTTPEDIHGPGVNIAARLQAHAEPGGIVISEAILNLVRSSLDRPLRDLGPLYLKNIPDPVRAFAIDPVGPAPAVPRFRRTAALPSIAILPLDNLGGDPADTYFADGIVEDIIVSLSSLQELLVISRGSALAMSREQTDHAAIGRALGVRYVMAGNVRRTAKRVRVAVQLHDVQNGVRLWGSTADGTPDDLFKMQDDIVAGVVAGIAPRVQSAELRDALRKRPESVTAYDHTLRALDCMHSLEKQTFMQARGFLEQAIAEDTNFAMPVAWAARWYSLLIGQGWSADKLKDSQAAIDLAARAIRLDGHNALALATYGHLRAFLFHDYDRALVYLERALAACPNSALAWILSSGTMSYVGRGEDAIRHGHHALRLSPFDQSLFTYYTFLGLAYYTHGAYEDAAKWGRMALGEQPIYTANLRILAAALAALGEIDEAQSVADRLLALEPGFTLTTFERTLLPFRPPALRTRYLDHLSKTGLPL